MENISIWKRRYFKVFSLISLIGLVVGAVAAYLYYFNIGCENGCAIRSNPYLSTLWGAAMGYLLGDMFVKKPTKEEEN